MEGVREKKYEKRQIGTLFTCLYLSIEQGNVTYSLKKKTVTGIRAVYNNTKKILMKIINKNCKQRGRITGFLQIRLIHSFFVRRNYFQDIQIGVSMILKALCAVIATKLVIRLALF